MALREAGALQSRGPFKRTTVRGDMGPGSAKQHCVLHRVRDTSLTYSITAACSGPCACLRSAALVEPIMIASGIAHRVTIITSW
jgi:hypothetical protein